MFIENKKQAALGRLLFLLIPLLFINIVAVLVFLGLQSDVIVLGALTVIFIFCLWFAGNLGFNYLYISFENEMLVIKYFSVSPVSGKHKMIEIPLQSLYKYEIETSIYGLRKDLILFRRTPKGIAKYPPVSITLLSDKDLAMLQKALSEVSESQ